MAKKSESTALKHSKGFRLAGTTMKAKEEQKNNIFKAKNDIGKRFLAAKRIYKNGKVKNRTSKTIVEKVNEEFNLTMLRSHLQLSDSTFIERMKFVIM